MTRDLTAEERSKERSLFYTTLADSGITLLLVASALTSGSLTMLSEAVRCVLFIAIQYYSIWTMRAVHRGRLGHYAFGVGKIEALVWVVAGVGLIVGGCWVAQAIVVALFSDDPGASPIGLAMAAVVNGVNTLINGLGLYAMYAATQDRSSGVFGSQVRARIGMLLFSTILQVTLTAAALAKDPGIALALDSIGAALVVYFKLRRGILMVMHGLPDLLDAPATDELADSIRRAADSVLPAGQLLAVRTRRSGALTFAEVEVAPDAARDVTTLRTRVDALRRAIGEQADEVDLTLVVGPAKPSTAENG